MKTLYGPIEPYQQGMLRVSEIHDIYYEQCGNPHGQPVVFLHGGPGAGLTAGYRRFFDPQAYRIVLFDQRGAGEQIVYEVDGLKTRFNQTPAIVGPSAGAGMQFVSGFTLYTVRNGVIEAGRFIPLGIDKEK